MAQVVTGAKAQVGFSDGINAFVPIAFASSINITHENRLEEIPQLDSYEVVEYAPNGHRCNFTVNFFKLFDAASNQYLDSRFYNLDSTDITTLLIQPELIFQVISEEADGEVRVLYEMTGVSFEGGTGQVDARGLWTGTWRFRARRGIGI